MRLSKSANIPTPENKYMEKVVSYSGICSVRKIGPRMCVAAMEEF